MFSQKNWYIARKSNINIIFIGNINFYRQNHFGLLFTESNANVNVRLFTKAIIQQSKLLSFCCQQWCTHSSGRKRLRVLEWKWCNRRMVGSFIVYEKTKWRHHFGGTRIPCKITISHRTDYTVMSAEFRTIK